MQKKIAQAAFETGLSGNEFSNMSATELLKIKGIGPATVRRLVEDPDFRAEICDMIDNLREVEEAVSTPLDEFVDETETSPLDELREKPGEVAKHHHYADMAIAGLIVFGLAVVTAGVVIPAVAATTAATAVAATV